VGEDQGGAGLEIRLQLVATEVAVRLVRDHDGDHVRARGGLARRQDREAVGEGLGPRRRTRLQPDDDVGDAGIAQVQGVGSALAAIADHGDALAADDGKVAVAVVEDGKRIR
jgi:hypothetical protein